MNKVELAYRKLKHAVYWDNTYSFIRGQIADFEHENNLEIEFPKIAQAIEQKNMDFFLRYINRVKYWQLPKKLKPENDKEDGVITNVTDTEHIIVTRDFKIINVDIRLHIISVLWILKGGFNLENEMSVAPYGNRLRLNSDKDAIIDGLPLFHPYHILYQKWRDEAFLKARQIVSEKKNALILSLDVMNYYPSLRLKFDDLKAKLPKDDSILTFLTEILEELHINYAGAITGTSSKDVGLPIGLQSSAVISNWYLSEFDKQVNDEINPAYYARYVDDIILVISNPKVDLKKGEIKSQIMDNYFANPITKIFRKEIVKTTTITIVNKEIVKTPKETTHFIFLASKTYESLRIQEDKLRIFYFDHKQPTALLDKIERELKIESSEFRLLPEHRLLKFDFFIESHYLSFTGSANKLRHVADFGINHLGTSQNLSKSILFSLQTERKKNEHIAEQILIFFNGARAIDTRNFWEKVITYFVVTKDKTGLLSFLKNIESSIEKIGYKPESDDDTDTEKQAKAIKMALKQLLIGAASMAFALDTKFIDFKQPNQNDGKISN